MSNNPIFRPCPFCGYEYPAMHGGPLVDYYWNVYCQICQCRGPVTKDHDEALAAWNGWTVKKKDWRKFKENIDANKTREQSPVPEELERDQSGDPESGRP